jgi:CBS domain-containing protein
MKIREIMSSDVRCTSPDSTLVEAAGLMKVLDTGVVPVCDDDRLAGILTDRDLAIRSTADGRDPNKTTVREVMSRGVVYIFDDQSLEQAEQLMEKMQIRRLPVLNREKRLVGIVSLGDLATHSQPALSGQALKGISQPA